MSKKKRFLKFFLLWTVLVLIFAFGTSFLILKAYGYKFNLKAGKIQKSGMLLLKSDPKEAMIKINGEKKSDKSPYKLDILPSKIKVGISKEGYVTWEKTVDILPGLVTEEENIILFKKEPRISSLSDENEKKLLELDGLGSGPSEIQIRNGELWTFDKLVTRFSSQISSAKWYPDENHILVLLKNGRFEIRVIELDGQNNTLLVSDEEISKFAILDNGRRLIYQTPKGYFEAKIR